MQSATGAPPVAGGEQIQREWYWLNGEQKKPIDVRAWMRYEPTQEIHLSMSYTAMQMEERTEGVVVDLAYFSSPPSPYKVCRANPIEVVNPNHSLKDGLAIAGYPKDLWYAPLHQLPPMAKHGKVVTGFYQIHRDYVDMLKELNEYLGDPQNRNDPTAREPCRRRVVILIEIERAKHFFGDVDRFRRKRTSTPTVALADAGEHDSVPPGEAVFQWWWGDPMTGWGHWKNYHPHVSAHLEKMLATREGFRSCHESVAIDEVRYRIQRISRERPFDYLQQNLAGNFRETFMPEHIVTIDNSMFDDMTRATSNCFVQFQNGNPKRRRPVRRIKKGDAAGLEMPSGEPCTICFSDTGVLTGCEKGHVVCHSCLRMGMRVIVGDISTTEGLICGCLSFRDIVALEGLAEKADITTRETLASPPSDPNLKQEFDMELNQVRRQFDIADAIPQGLYKSKMKEWFEKLRQKESEHLYYACKHPGCGMENWILREDFDKDYRCRGLYNWTCRRGHKNSVLPSQDEINDVNKNILLHPECYDERCAHDSFPLRRFRLCEQCVAEGLLTFAVHESGCKQWPGGGASTAGHRHCFCFHCCAVWGRDCDHSKRCRDPGIQQVRKNTTLDGSESKLEVGYIDAQAYIAWIKGTRSVCPPTVFGASGLFSRSEQVVGLTRQGLLGLEDKSYLKRTMEQGTS